MDSGSGRRWYERSHAVQAVEFGSPGELACEDELMHRCSVVFVHADDALVRRVGPKLIPMPPSISHVRSLAAEGAELWSWSTGGATYARSIAEDLDLADCFKGFLPKPNVIVDDQAVVDWRQCIEVGPGALAETVADYAPRLSGPP